MKKWWMTILAVILIVPMLVPEKAEASSIGSQIVSKAKEYQGVPYRFGGTTTSGFDCSGYTQHVFRQFGVDLPRTAAQQQQVGTPVSKSNLQPGDLVFFANTYKSGVSHNGIYIGNNKFIGSQSSTGVAIVSLNNTYWGPRYHSARRVVNTAETQVASSRTYEELPAGQYHDVKENHWAHNVIKELGEQGIISGYANSFFKPEESITRAQAAMLLNRHLQLSTDGAKSFRDVNGSTMGQADIAAVSANGLMSGYSDGTFRPNDRISREEIATILDRAFEWGDVSVNNANAANKFSDVSRNDWSYNHVATLSELGIISGFEDGTFRPGNNTTRAQFASLLHRAMNY